MDIESYELRSPADLIAEVASRVSLTEGSAYAVLVGDPSRAQSVRDIETLSCGAFIEADDVRDLLEELCGRWDQGARSRPSEVKVVTVVVRRGLCVWTPLEWAWSNAWRHAFTSGLSCGDLITVTEHGWYDFMTKHADHLPALVELHPAAQG
jgi:hypothetical protein